MKAPRNVWEKQHRCFLIETTDTIRRLIAEKPESVSKFHENSKLFQDKHEAHFQALQEAERRAAENPALRDYNEGTPPSKNMEWFADPHNQRWRFWTAPLPFDPYQWISYYYGGNPWQLYEKPKEPSKDENLMCEYVVLGLIYDQVSDVVECKRLCTINISDVRSGLWDKLQLNTITAPEEGEKIRSRMNIAIDHVKADLQNNNEQGLLEAKPPEILQELLWIRKHGRKYWKVILLAIVVLLLSGIFVLPKFDLFSKIYSLIKSICP